MNTLQNKGTRRALQSTGTGRAAPLCLLLLLIAVSSLARAQGVPRAECFPVERLPAPLRPKAEALLLAMLDSEALYTLVGGMKPMSSGYARYETTVAKPDTARLETMRQLLSVARCGDEFYADVQIFATVYNGKRMGEAVLFHLPTLTKKIAEYSDFFGGYGITASSHPMETLMVVEHDPTFDRNRGYGYLFGYPRYAVDFFVQSQESEKQTKQFVKRDFLSIPTFKSDAHLFVWAVPKGYQETDADRQTKSKAALILAAYKARRARYIGEGKPGVVALLRDWFDDGQGHCSAANARVGEDAAPAFSAAKSGS